MTNHIFKSPIITGYGKMIINGWRNKFFYDALQLTAKNKIVMDVGTGTGILAMYALIAGAKFVYAIESNEEAAKMAEYVLSRNFDRSRFKVINCNFWTDAIDDQIELHSIDILVSETVGPGLFDQGMVTTWICARPFLKDDAISIPDKLHCDLYVWDSDYTEHIKNIKTELADTSEHFELLSTDALSNEYIKALTEYDILLQEANPIQQYPIQWVNVNTDMPRPDTIYTDVIGLTKDSSIDVTYFDDPATFPAHILPKLQFELELEKGTPKTVAVINKISFMDIIIYLQDAPYMPWKYSPLTIFKHPGKHQFTFPGLNFTKLVIWNVTDINND